MIRGGQRSFDWSETMMCVVSQGRQTFSAAEAEEIRRLLDGVPRGTRSQRRMAQARLRHMGFLSRGDHVTSLTALDFERLVSSGAVSILSDGDSARAHIRQHP